MVHPIKQILYKTEATEAWWFFMEAKRRFCTKRHLESTTSHLWIILKAAHCRMSPELDDIVHTVTTGIQ